MQNLPTTDGVKLLTSTEGPETVGDDRESMEARPAKAIVTGGRASTYYGRPCSCCGSSDHVRLECIFLKI
jgi:hypothetical protein